MRAVTELTRDGQTFLMLQGTELSLSVTLNWFDQQRTGRK